jgi:hypothetical protein
MEEGEMSQQPREKAKKRFVNMNYPPDDMSLEEQERFWGEPFTKEEKADIDEARRSKLPNANRSRPRLV